MFYISPSQIKTANASIAKRAGEKLLGLYQEYQSDAFILGNAFETYICEGVDNLKGACEGKTIYDIDGLQKDYES